MSMHEGLATYIQEAMETAGPDASRASLASAAADAVLPILEGLRVSVKLIDEIMAHLGEMGEIVMPGDAEAQSQLTSCRATFRKVLEAFNEGNAP